MFKSQNGFEHSQDERGLMRIRKVALRGILVGLATGALLFPTAASAAPSSASATASSGEGSVIASKHAIAGQYIVLFKDSAVSAASVSPKADRLARSVSGRILFRYDAAVRGFAVKTTPANAKKLAKDPSVRAVYQDGVDSVNTVQPVPAPPNSYWGLDQINQRTTALDRKYSYTATGAGVTVYVIDTGIRATHSEFAGRVAPGISYISDGRGTDDCHGHGTHVAGTIGGRTYGVAKGVTLVPVRVLSCTGEGSKSSTIAGINWVVSKKLASPKKPMLINMSLGGDYYFPEDIAVHNAYEAGVASVVAAGNSNDDAYYYSPASTLTAITVGAVGNYSSSGVPQSRYRASFSNYGQVVDLFAPGVFIKSAGITSNTATAIMSGTSMAAPHVTGVAALYLSKIPAANPLQLRNAIVGNATKNYLLLKAAEGSPNRLLFTNY